MRRWSCTALAPHLMAVIFLIGMRRCVNKLSARASACKLLAASLLAHRFVTAVCTPMLTSSLQSATMFTAWLALRLCSLSSWHNYNGIVMTLLLRVDCAVQLVALLVVHALPPPGRSGAVLLLDAGACCVYAYSLVLFNRALLLFSAPVCCVPRV